MGRGLLAVGLGILLLLGVQVAVQAGTAATDGAGSARSRAREEHVADPEDPWRAIEAAYHQGERELLRSLEARLPADERANFTRVLAEFDGLEASTSSSRDASAPQVGLDGNPCAYATIGAAIAAASDGATVYIPSGYLYYEQLGSIGKDLHLTAATSDCTASVNNTAYIDGNGNDGGTWGGMASIAMGQVVTFSHISLQNARAIYGGIVYVNPGAKLVLDEGAIAGGTAVAFGGGVRVYSATLVTHGTLFFQNAVTGTVSGGGAIAAYNGVLTLTDSTNVGLFTSGNASADRGGGLDLENSRLHAQSLFVLNNHATDAGGGIYARAGSTLDLYYSSVGLSSASYSNTAQYGGRRVPEREQRPGAPREQRDHPQRRHGGRRRRVRRGGQLRHRVGWGTRPGDEQHGGRQRRRALPDGREHPVQRTVGGWRDRG
jgi:predicted outer membrane repeat protein